MENTEADINSEGYKEFQKVMEEDKKCCSPFKSDAKGGAIFMLDGVAVVLPSVISVGDVHEARPETCSTKPYFFYVNYAANRDGGKSTGFSLKASAHLARQRLLDALHDYYESRKTN